MQLRGKDLLEKAGDILYEYVLTFSTSKSIRFCKLAFEKIQIVFVTTESGRRTPIRRPYSFKSALYYSELFLCEQAIAMYFGYPADAYTGPDQRSLFLRFFTNTVGFYPVSPTRNLVPLCYKLYVEDIKAVTKEEIAFTEELNKRLQQFKQSNERRNLVCSERSVTS